MHNICLAYNRNRYKVFANTEINLLVPHNEDNTFTSGVAICFSKRSGRICYVAQTFTLIKDHSRVVRNNIRQSSQIRKREAFGEKP